jgi:mRNA-degrading endonuclease RelE of RelBE toxin-antitoxin system
MSYKFSATPAFEKQVKRLSKNFPSLPEDLLLLKKELTENPTSGASLGNNCYKVRVQIKSKGKGKSGGARVITCVLLVDKEIYMLDIYDKSEKENITQTELLELIQQIQ